MKAILFKKYGPPETLQIEEIKKPVPKRSQVLIKILASTVTSGVSIVRKADFPVRLIIGPFKPLFWKILGIEFSGIIEEVGDRVTRFTKGDEVFGSTGFGMGTFAEYKCLDEKKAFDIKPTNLTWSEAAAIPVGGYTALYFLRDKGNIQQGQKILIYGASGSVGTYAVQIAKHYGTEVTGVCSTSNVELVKSLGADMVIDYKSENALNEYEIYDIIFDAVGKCPPKVQKDHLVSDGKFLTVSKGLARGNPENLVFLKQLVEEGKLRPVIDKVFKMEEIAQAFRYVEEGHKRGNVVVTITENPY